MIIDAQSVRGSLGGRPSRAHRQRPIRRADPRLPRFRFVPRPLAAR
jgi:hypothetical protein